MSTADLESRRLTLQATLDEAKSRAERNRLGQFATPTRLADDILRYARTLIPLDEEVRFLDPAIGSGSFYSALRRQFTGSDLGRCIGFEIDDVIVEVARDLWRDSTLSIHEADFISQRPPTCEEQRATLVICNPPYVRHHHLESATKLQAREFVAAATGRRLSGLSGLYCYFMLRAHEWMADGALAGWLVPSEFLDVNYGRVVKEYLLEDVTLLRVHRFDPSDPQFDDALVSSAVVWFRKNKPPAEHSVVFSYGGSLPSPAVSQEVSIEALRHEAKWTGLCSSIVSTPRGAGAHGPRLRDILNIKRGLATGRNDYFIVDEAKAIELRLPREFLQPILPSPRYLPEDEIQTDEAGEPVLSRRLYLINCSLPEVEVATDFPALWEYFQTGVARGIDKAYLCLHRTPWYAQEYRPPSPFLVTYMSRQRTDGSAFRFIFNPSEATAANVYLMLYPKRRLAEAIANTPGLARETWLALKAITNETLIRNGRVYGGGLHKLEPKELANVPADRILDILPGDFQTLSGEQARLL